jgi:hypothetical protein
MSWAAITTAHVADGRVKEVLAAMGMGLPGGVNWRGSGPFSNIGPIAHTTQGVSKIHSRAASPMFFPEIHNTAIVAKEAQTWA